MIVDGQHEKSHRDVVRGKTLCNAEASNPEETQR